MNYIEEVNILKAIKKRLEEFGFEFNSTWVDNSWICHYVNTEFEITVKKTGESKRNIITELTKGDSND